jgi:sec-independent protein translocase protein TatA
MPNIGLPEIIIVLVIALVIFGPKRLPELGRSLGNGMREFKDSIAGNSDDDDDEQKPELESSSSDDSAAEPVEGEVVESRS